MTAFLRFFLGVFLAAFFIRRGGESFKPKSLRHVVVRGISNTIAVILFFGSVQYTTVTNANMLNMTYPAFVFLIAPLFGREKSHPLLPLFLVSTLGGIFLIVNPDFHSLHLGDILGVLSGIAAAFGVSSLRVARKYDSSAVILFYLMVIGTLTSLFIAVPLFKPYTLLGWALAAIGGLFGVAGQACITEGYRFVSAKAGSLVSSSRILFAFALGTLLLGDPLSWKVIAGGGLILLSLIGVSILENRFQSRTSAPADTDPTL